MTDVGGYVGAEGRVIYIYIYIYIYTVYMTVYIDILYVSNKVNTSSQFKVLTEKLAKHNTIAKCIIYQTINIVC